MDDWEARAHVNGQKVVIAAGSAETIRDLATAELERRNISACRLWELVERRWVDVGEAIWNTRHDRDSPVRD